MLKKQEKAKQVMVLQVAEIAYYLYFAIMVFAKGIGLYEGMWPYTASLLIGAAFILIKLALTEHTLAECRKFSKQCKCNFICRRKFGNRISKRKICT